ncbi:MAG: RtcB family protein [Planctomycetaceae bacterium]
MNARQLEKLGVPKFCINTAIKAVQSVAKYNRTVEKPLRIDIRDALTQCIAHPEKMIGDTHFGELARTIIEDQEFTMPEPVEYKTWGAEGIDAGSHQQMQQACALPMATAGALMPDAHVGYGLPIGGVLALENAVVPYAVGVDIACRMKLTVYDIPPLEMQKRRNIFADALEKGTVFGVGAKQQKLQEHPVLDEDWTVSRITREKKELAHTQLGTSGSGNHFVEWGVLFLDEDDADLALPAGEYVALLSHSGSRGTGASVCRVYSSIARDRLPKRYADFGRLAWLDMDSEAGQEYWAAMNLMGDYAAANHDVIHRRVGQLIGEKPIAMVENHHNFAWLEEHGGKSVYVHRKGATPAGAGVLGVIPGSMGDPAYVVRGKGNEDSLKSASHGAGRRMSRTKAKETYNFRAVRNSLAKKGIQVLSAGADEVPGVYKNINEVMAQQRDLVDPIARFEPRIVKMCGDGSRAED